MDRAVVAGLWRVPCRNANGHADAGSFLITRSLSSCGTSCKRANCNRLNRMRGSVFGVFYAELPGAPGLGGGGIHTLGVAQLSLRASCQNVVVVFRGRIGERDGNPCALSAAR